MRKRAIIAASCVLLCFVLLCVACTVPLSEPADSGDDDPPAMVPDPILDRDYAGTLTLQFSNVFPEFNEQGQCAVDVDHEFGIITFQRGSLDYLGDETNSDGFRMRRDGTLTMHPSGHFEVSGDVTYVQVIENTDVSEVLQAWAPDGTLIMNETVTDFWDGGLSFDFMEAQISGSVCQVVNAQGSAVWTLVLLPAIVP